MKLQSMPNLTEEDQIQLASDAAVVLGLNGARDLSNGEIDRVMDFHGDLPYVKQAIKEFRDGGILTDEMVDLARVKM